MSYNYLVLSTVKMNPITAVKNEKAGYLIDGSSSGCASVIGIHQRSFH
jgi:hypothetical protein